MHVSLRPNLTPKLRAWIPPSHQLTSAAQHLAFPFITAYNNSHSTASILLNTKISPQVTAHHSLVNGQNCWLFHNSPLSLSRSNPISIHIPLFCTSLSLYLSLQHHSRREPFYHHNHGPISLGQWSSYPAKDQRSTPLGSQNQQGLSSHPQILFIIHATISSNSSQQATAPTHHHLHSLAQDHPHWAAQLHGSGAKADRDEAIRRLGHCKGWGPKTRGWWETWSWNSRLWWTFISICRGGWWGWGSWYTTKSIVLWCTTFHTSCPLQMPFCDGVSKTIPGVLKIF